MRDLIFISLENWDGVWRRNQFLCAEWLRRFPEMRLLFVGRFRDCSHSVRFRDPSILSRPAVEKVADLPEAIRAVAQDGDVVVTMGAGSIGGVPGQLAPTRVARRSGTAVKSRGKVLK